MMAASAQPLESVCTLLGSIEEQLQGADQAASALAAVQQACGVVLSTAAGASADSPELEMLLLSLSRLGKVLQALDACISTLDVPAAYEDSLWSSSVLPLVNILLFSERWQAVLQQLSVQSDLGRQLQEAGKSVVRDGIIPILCSVATRCPPSNILRLGGTYSAFLDLGASAAAFAGYQCSRAIDLTGRMTHNPYLALNLCWHGIARLWTVSSLSVRRQLHEQGMGVDHLCHILCGFLRQDMEALVSCEQPSGRASTVKRLHFWLMLVNKLAVGCPEASTTGWDTLLKWHVHARHKLRSCNWGRSDEAAIDAAEAEIFSKAARFQVLMLNCIKAEDLLKVAVGGLRARLSAGHEAGDKQQALALPTLLVAVDILQCAAAMKSRVRQHCVQLVPDVMDALMQPACAGLLLSQGGVALLQRMEEALLVFLAACCNSSSESSEDLGAWHRAQRQLFLLALQPHPLVAEVLSRSWSDLIRLGDQQIAQQHIPRLRQLLQAAAITQDSSSSVASPLVMHLSTLLSSLLSAAPAALASDFLNSALEFSPMLTRDAAYLACLSADLRVATLTDAASSSSTCAPAVQAALHLLSAALHDQMAGSSFLQRLVQQPADAPEVATFAQLLDCIEQAIAYMVSCGTAPADSSGLLALADDLVHTCTAAAAAGGPYCWAPAAFGALANLCDLFSDQPALGDAQLGALLPALEACQKHGETAACIASLAAAFKWSSSVLPTSLFHSVLSNSDPLLRFIGLEAYLGYMRKCDGSVATAMLPTSMIDPETGVMSSEHCAIFAQHLARRTELEGLDLQLHSWAAMLQGIASGAAAQLMAAARACASNSSTAEEPGHAVGQFAEEAAVQALSAALAQLQQVAEAGGGSWGASTVQRLQQCSMQLREILAAHGEAV